MEKLRLFTYGTLQHPEIQLQVFGKSLEGTTDSLPNYMLGTIQLPENDPEANTYFIAIYTGNPNDCVEGIWYTITPQNLSAIDNYEGPDYERVSVILKSGKEALVYRKPI